MGQSVDRIIIILNFVVGISKNKSIDHRIKETCTIMSTQIAYEIHHISVLCHSTMSGELNFLFFYVFYCDLKEKYHIRKDVNCEKKEKLLCEIPIIILICQKLESVRPVQQKIKLPLP